MKALFVFKSYEWLGIEYLSSVLKKAGHLTDIAFEHGLGGTFYFSFSKKKNAHTSILKKIKEFGPDLILFSSTTSLFPWVLDTASKIKKFFDTPIIVGGIHPTIAPERVITDQNVDMICMGEGENSVVELADKMDSGHDYFDTKNIWFKSNNEIIKNDLHPLIQDLDTLPYPDKDLFYNYGCLTDRAYVITGRGCPYDCPYCYNHQLKKIYCVSNNIYVRRRSVYSIIDELEWYKRKYRIKSIHFFDDTFLVDRNWLFEFSKLYRDKIALPFYCMINIHTADEDIIIALREAGCKMIGIGLESGNSHIRNSVLKRNMSDEKIIRITRLIKKHGIKLVTFNMFCFPGETPSQMLDTVNMNFTIKPNALFTFTFYPFPGTNLTRLAREKNYIDDETYNRILVGEENYTSRSILQHPFRDIAYNIKIILPLLNKLPNRLRKYFTQKWIFKKHTDLLLTFMKILSIPFFSHWEAKARAKEQISMLKTFYLSTIKQFIKGATKNKTLYGERFQRRH